MSRNSKNAPRLPWTEPTYSGNLRSYRRNLHEYRKACRLAATVEPWQCPTCRVRWPGVTKRGATRVGCPDPKCRSKARSVAASEQGRNRNPSLGRDVVASIRNTYRPKEYGYKVIARIYGIDPSTVRDIVLGRTHKED